MNRAVSNIIGCAFIALFVFACISVWPCFIMSLIVDNREYVSNNKKCDTVCSPYKGVLNKQHTGCTCDLSKEFRSVE